jgi:hypothetical protein
MIEIGEHPRPVSSWGNAEGVKGEEVGIFPAF